MTLVIPQPTPQYDQPTAQRWKQAIEVEDARNRKKGSDLALTSERLTMLSPNGTCYQVVVGNDGGIHAAAALVSGRASPSAPLTAALGADVVLNSLTTYFPGPSIAQGTVGTWLVTATVTLHDTAGAATFHAKLWDGTTIFASGAVSSAAANYHTTITLSAVVTSPSGNLRLDVKDVSGTTGVMSFNLTGNSKDSAITAFRIGG